MIQVNSHCELTQTKFLAILSQLWTGDGFDTLQSTHRHLVQESLDWLAVVDGKSESRHIGVTRRRRLSVDFTHSLHQISKLQPRKSSESDGVASCTETNILGCTLSECQKGRVVKNTYQHFPLDGRPCQNALWVLRTPCQNSPICVRMHHCTL